ncbi:MAG: hypothetical protein NTZ05_15085, partial [Chloroflexi bacterium]|nr:hypothetical protein [Chloroflexota bacterium]
YRRFSVNDFPIRRDAFTGAYHQDFAEYNLGDRNLNLTPVAQNACRGGLEGDQSPNRLAAASSGEIFDPVEKRMKNTRSAAVAH